MSVHGTQRPVRQLRHGNHQVGGGVEEAVHRSALVLVHRELGGLEGVDVHLPPLHRGQGQQQRPGFVIEVGDVPGVEAEALRQLRQGLRRDGLGGCHHRSPVRHHPEGPGHAVRQEGPVLVEHLLGEPGVAVAVDAFYVHHQGSPLSSPFSWMILAQNSWISAFRPSRASLYSMEQSPRLPLGWISRWP